MNYYRKKALDRAGKSHGEHDDNKKSAIRIPATLHDVIKAVATLLFRALMTGIEAIGAALARVLGFAVEQASVNANGQRLAPPKTKDNRDPFPPDVDRGDGGMAENELPTKLMLAKTRIRKASADRGAMLRAKAMQDHGDPEIYDNIAVVIAPRLSSRPARRDDPHTWTSIKNYSPELHDYLKSLPPSSQQMRDLRSRFERFWASRGGHLVDLADCTEAMLYILLSEAKAWKAQQSALEAETEPNPDEDQDGEGNIGAASSLVPVRKPTDEDESGWKP